MNRLNLASAITSVMLIATTSSAQDYSGLSPEALARYAAAQRQQQATQRELARIINQPGYRVQGDSLGQYITGNCGNLTGYGSPWGDEGTGISCVEYHRDEWRMLATIKASRVLNSKCRWTADAYVACQF